MDKLIEYILEHTEAFSIVGAVALVVLIIIVIELIRRPKGGGKNAPPVKINVQVNPNINSRNNNRNNSGPKNNSGRKGSNQKPKPGNQNPRPTNNNQAKGNSGKVTLANARLYAQGPRGKIHTDTIRKAMNSSFGIDITVKNNGSSFKKANIRWSINGSNGSQLESLSKELNVNAYNSVDTSFYVRDNLFSHMQPGKYSYKIWINGELVKNVGFTVCYN